MSLASLHDAVVTANNFPLLTGVTASFEAGQVYAVSGPNGAGKTSLLRLLAGLEPLVRGSGEVLGRDLRTTARREIRRHVGWLGHEGPFYDELTLRENLVFAARVSRIATQELDNVISTVGLSGRRDLRAKHLSAGQRRRMGMAWLLLRRPELWLLDEPYASLDSSARSLVDDIIAQAARAGSCVVVTSHDELRTSAPVTSLILHGGAL